MEEKKKHKVVIGIEVVLLCMIIAIIGMNAASSNPPSSGVSYSKNSQTTVEGALNDLYTKANYGNATASQILKGKTALVGGKQVTGTYEAPSLASQTEGNATAEDLTEGKIAWVNGKKIVGATKTIADRLRIGDYISYTSSNTSYTISKADTGSASDKTINPSELKLWRVIRKNANGTVELVSQYTSSVDIFFIGTTGYYNYIGTLNKIAKSYENSTYTIGSRHMGYDATKANEYVSSVGTGDSGYETDRTLVEVALGTLHAKNSSTSYSFNAYWIASRSGVYSSTGDAKNGQCYYVGNDSFINYAPLTTSRGGGVRPIVVLKSTLKITGGDGTASSPYTLGV